MRKLFTLLTVALFATSLWAVDLSKGATYDLTTFSTTDFTNANSTYWTADATTPTYYANGSNFKPTSASDFILNSNDDKITKLDGLKVITGSSSGRARIYVNGNGLYFNSDGAKLVMPGLKAGQEIVLTYKNAGSNEAGFTLTNATGVQDKTKKTETLTVTADGDVTVTYKSNKFYITRIEISSSCEAADATFTAASTNLAITNEVAAPSTTLTFTKGDNTSDPTYAVTKGGEATTDASIEGTTFTATAAGTYVVTATQVYDSTYCEVIKQVSITVTAQIPVTTCTIDGATSGYASLKLTYTATAANATAYEWYLDGVKQGSDSAKFIYTAVKGNHSIYCKARNAYNKDGEENPTWVSSAEKALTVSPLYGEIITFTAETGSGNIDKDITSTGIVGGTAHQKTDKNGKIGSNGYYISLQLASGSFLAGDTVRIVSSTSYSKIHLFSDAGVTSVAEKDAPAQNDYVILSETVAKLYLYRNETDNKNMNPTVTSMSVIRPKKITSVTETLTAVSVNGNPFDAAALNSLKTNHSYNIENGYAIAPTIKFSKLVTTTYEDDSQKEATDSVVVTATENEGAWRAQATINEILYTVTAVKLTSYTITYKYGGDTLHTEIVAANGNPAEYNTAKNKVPCASLDGWYSKSDLTGDAVVIAEAVITKDTTFYGKFTYEYATSINIEQLVLDNGKGYDLVSNLGTLHYATNWTNDLDSLDDSKDNRNYAYLGQKVKAAGKMIDFRLANGSTVKVKFGNVPDDVKVVINGKDSTVAKANLSSPFTYTATADSYLSIRSTSGSTLVFKQIMIDEPIADIDLPTGIDEIEAASKAVKFFENGQMYIRRGEKVYTVTGAEVK